MMLVLPDMFIFKQKSAYELRISDWSSDVCSSDLVETRAALSGQRALLDVIEHRYEIGIAVAADVERAKLQLFQIEALVPALDDARRRAANRIAVLIGRPPGTIESMLSARFEIPLSAPCGTGQIGRASGRERGCTYE